MILCARALYDTTKYGSNLVDYSDANRATFYAGILVAEVVNQNSTSTQNELSTAISNIKNAVRAYHNSIVSYAALIVNPDFEYKSAGVLTDGTTFRGIPYGWSSNGTLIGNSFGINSDTSNYSGSNLCWINSTPMPAKFEIYQVLNNLSEGEYTVKCRQASFVGQLTNMRLFANRNVQYYGNPSDYDKNLNATEVNTFGEIPVALIPVQYCRK